MFVPCIMREINTYITIKEEIIVLQYNTKHFKLLNNMKSNQQANHVSIIKCTVS